MSPRDLRVALVTGAARGIGAATVRRLLDSGYAVVAVDGCSGSSVPDGVAYRLGTRAELDQVASTDPGRVLAVRCDVRDLDGIAGAVEEGIGRFGHLDVVVAAAGVIAGGALAWETPTAHLQTLLDVNVLGVWNTAAAAIPALLAGPDPANARFVALASAAGSHGLERLSAYCASKHAVIGLVRGLAADLAGTGTTAVALALGSTDTEMLSATAALYAVPREDFARHQRIGRLLTPDEIAETIAFCCSRAGGALNGSVLHADGGFVG